MPAARRRATESSAFYRYLAAAHGRFDRVIADATLREPRIKHFDRAVQLVDRLIETTLGLAIGRMIGAVVHGMRASFGYEVARRIDRILGGATIEAPQNAVLDLAPQCFGDVFRGDVRRRLLLAPRTVRPVAEAIAAVANEQVVVERVLELLAEDPLPAERFAGEVAEGWRVFASVAGDQQATTQMPLWIEWLARVAGPRAVVTALPEGYINRIG
jgi:hypothetical protein